MKFTDLLPQKSCISKPEKKSTIIQFIQFGLVGVSNTLVSWICYYIILWINEDWYMAGSIVGGIVSIANAFFWNDRFVFAGGKKDWKSKLKRLGKTYVSYGVTSLFSVFFLWFEVTVLGVGKAIAPVINTCIMLPFNFLINKLWTFKGGDQ